MAHFAEINQHNIVQRIIVMNVSDSNESDGERICSEIYGGNWKQTSYNGKIRKNYAGIGYAYDEERDAFIPSKPHASWILNEETCQWKAPIEMPEGPHRWSELLGKWIPIKWLFENYGLTQDYSLIASTVEKYELKNRTLVPVIIKPEYVISLEKANNILFGHAQATEWTSEIKRLFLDDMDELHKEIGTVVYIYHWESNEELQGSKPYSLKFAELIGFTEYENVILGDEQEHFIFKREVPVA